MVLVLWLRFDIRLIMNINPLIIVSNMLQPAKSGDQRGDTKENL